MAKKLSVAEILAAARAEKGGSAAAATSADSEQAPVVATEAPTATEATVESTPPPSPAASPPSAAGAPAGGKFTPGGKGMNMADILAAARAKPGAAKAPATAVSAKSAAPKTEAKPPAEKAAAKPAEKPAAAKEAAASAATPKDTASILTAARKGAKPGPMTKAEAAAKAVPVAPTGKKKIEVPPMPAKPAYAREAAVAGASPARRTFFAMAAGVLFGSSMAIGFTSLAAVNLMWLLGLARFMFPNILIEPPTRFKVGFPDQFAPGQVETKFIPQFGVWIVRYEFDGQPMVFALKSVCTHLGCTPNWLEAEQKFKCPCHGSGFYKDGVNFEGPAPRPLERYSISLSEDGQLLVDKSRTFQQELGQWKDTASFVVV